MSAATEKGEPTAVGPRVFDLLHTPLEDGITVVEASAGTGKTYCLTGLVLRLLLERRVASVGEILVVTFTNAATEELVGRVRRSLRQAHALFDGRLDVAAADPFLRGLVERHGEEGREILRLALLDFDQLLVSTIHGFCHRLLEESAFESGLPFDAELLENDDELLLDAVRDAWRRLLAEDRHGLLAGLALARSLRPESFVGEIREVSRYPGTEILPEPLSVDAALDALSAARERLATAWSAARVRHFLSRKKLRSRSELAEARRLRTLAREVEAFAGGRFEALGSVEYFIHESLERDLLGPLDELAAEPAFAAADEAWQAVLRLEHAVRCRVVRESRRDLEAAKEERGVLAFDDLLRRVRRALADPRRGERLRRAVRRRLSAVLVDEFQDTDLVQYEIFRRLFADGPLVLVGDPKQAIYRFRGADVFAYLAAKRDADRVYTLGRNWRSSRDLVSAVNALFAAERPFVYRDIPHPPVEAAESTAGRRLVGDGRRPLQWHWLGEEGSVRRASARLVRWTASEVVRLLSSDLELVDGEGTSDGRALRPADLAVLVRTNDQARDVREALARVGVPAVVSRSGDVFHTDEMEDLERILRAIADPGDPGLLRAACATLAWGDDAAALHRLSEDDEAYQRRVDDLLRYRRIWKGEGDGGRGSARGGVRGFVAMMRRWIDEQGVRSRLLALDDGERRLTNLLHGIEILHQASHDERLSPAGLVAWLARERRRSSHDREATELRLESDAAAVEISTLHKAKGLEYEVVLCPFLWQAWPVAAAPVTVHRSPRDVVRDHGSRRLEEHLAMADAERLAEDLRLVYVALTRARRRCLVAWGAIGRGRKGAPGSADSALAYLLHRRQRSLPGSDEAAEEGTEAARWARRGLDDAGRRADEWRSDLESWAADRPDLAEVVEIENDEPMPWRGEEEAPGELRPRRPRPDLPEQLRPWQIASFTALLRRSGDERDDTSLDRTVHAEYAPAEARDGEKRTTRDLFVLARGPRIGRCLHDVLEECDFPRAAEGGLEVRREVLRILERYALHRTAAHGPEAVERDLDPSSVVVDLLGRVVHAELPAEGAPIRLAGVGRDRRLSEWQFWTPWAAPPVHELAQVFRRHGDPRWAEEYAERLERLDPARLPGFLTGYLDLAFEHGGRFHLVDWKSNHLGDEVAHYRGASLLRAMVEHHYLLQYHLYAVALRRYLRFRSPDARLGEVYYLFLRGLPPAPRADSPSRADRADRSVAAQLDLFAPSSDLPDLDGPGEANERTEPLDGIFHDRPSARILDALEEILFPRDLTQDETS